MGSDFKLVPGVQTTYITVDSGDQESGLFPQTKVYNSSDTVVATVNLTAVVGSPGLYSGSWTPTLEGEYLERTIFYADSGHTTVQEAYGFTNSKVTVKTLVSQSAGGGGGMMVGVSREEMDDIAEKVWAYKLGKLKASQVLLNKSEFNPATEIVNAGITMDMIEESLVRHDKYETIKKDLKASITLLTKTISSDGDATRREVQGIDLAVDLKPVLSKFDALISLYKGLEEYKPWILQIRQSVSSLQEATSAIQSQSEEGFKEVSLTKSAALSREFVPDIKEALQGVLNAVEAIPEKTTKPVIDLVQKVSERVKLAHESLENGLKNKTESKDLKPIALYVQQLRAEIGVLEQMLEVMYSQGRSTSMKSNEEWLQKIGSMEKVLKGGLTMLNERQ